MPYIKFTSYEQVWQSREVIWREADWKTFKSKLAKRAQQIAEMGNEYYIKFYEAIKDMSFDDAMKEYEKWLYEEEGYSTFCTDGYNCPIGEAIHEALCEAADDVAPVIDSICDCRDEGEVCED